MPPVELGQKAPAFSLKDQDGRRRSLKDYAGRPVVLYFYPKDGTPGCTREACAFRDALAAFTKRKAAVLGVGVLHVATKARFARRHQLAFPLLSDNDHAVAEKYGAWKEKSMYGKTYMGVARMTFLIGAVGKVARRWDDVKVDRHAGEVLAAVEEL